MPLPDEEETVTMMPLPTEELVHALPITSAPAASFSKPSHSSARPINSSSLPPAPSKGTMAGFVWPATTPTANTTLANSGDNNANQRESYDDDIDDTTAWSGTDNAIPARLHDPPLRSRTLPWLSPPHLHSTSAAVRRIQRVWNMFRRDCVPCKRDGVVICEHDVADWVLLARVCGAADIG